MKSAIVFAAVLAVSAAQQFFNQRVNRPTYAPQPALVNVPNRGQTNEADAQIVRYENTINPDNSYTYTYETTNGIAATEQGTPRNFGGNPPVIPVVSQGQFSWTSPEGEQIGINYIADENGYQPQGNALPTPPPIPPQILRALEYIANNPPRQ